MYSLGEQILTYSIEEMGRYCFDVIAHALPATWPAIPTGRVTPLLTEESEATSIG